MPASRPGARLGPTNPFVEFGRAATAQSIPARFAGQAARHADRIALRTRRQALTYRALSAAVDRAAAALRAREGRGEAPVALLLGHDAPMVVAMLGALRAGRAYVALDPAHPAARSAYVLADSQASLLVTERRYRDLAGRMAGDRTPILDLDADGAPGEPEVAHPPGVPGRSAERGALGAAAPPIPSEAIAYLAYTSGTTGAPKGAAQSHRYLLQCVRAYTNAVHLCAGDRLSLLTSMSFGRAARVIFSALLNGAALCLLDVRQEGIAGLAPWLVQEGITIYDSTTTLFREWVGTLGPVRLDGLRLVNLGGETVSARDVAAYRRHFGPQCLLRNGLSATEAGVVTSYFVGPTTEIPGDVVPVGYPVPGMRVLALDDRGREVAPGEIGEIAVQSRDLSPGYWRRPGLTAARFRPAPGGSAERIYLTGDLGYKMADGGLVHLGRRDFQVKVRGHRVDTGAIEDALVALGTIREAVVLAREDRPDALRLVAYLVPGPSPLPTVDVVRRALAQALPDYMIPSVFVALAALPRTPSGKVDRRALADHVPGGARPELETPFQAARTPVEAALARIWAEVLDLDRVGIDDQFFDLGGHSLLAARLVARVVERLGSGASPPELFAALTIREMALAIVLGEAARVERASLDDLLLATEAAPTPAPTPPPTRATT